jgi:hypothetical protein
MWILDPAGQGRHPIYRKAIMQVQSMQHKISKHDDAYILALPTLEQVLPDPSNSLQTMTMQPYSKDVSDFIVDGSVGQQRFREQLLWFHPPKTSSTMCATLHLLTCHGFPFPDDEKYNMVVWNGCISPQGMIEYCKIKTPVRNMKI